MPRVAPASSVQRTPSFLAEFPPAVLVLRTAVGLRPSFLAPSIFCVFWKYWEFHCVLDYT
ncbi:DBF4-type zinc finger-containing protein 2-like protein [Iris pallida]|uniref:DBF4-type zinc finger-containing protein 2-like protein n=1 Tax=Iris pallida TaxID=29817 RepID=A0AAX6DKH8_IRIPA|nr:DBF4-type zinc finger-containing protein 2-like protein [Iris pallida]